MQYTVNTLAKISGVSARTLRFYDDIGLLKPAFYGDNHYRYYQEEQLLMLQQILFFRALGFPLNDIKQIISSNDFNKIEALNTHKSLLQAGVDRSLTLINTIDKTIAHIKGKLNMREQEMYDGFDPIQQEEHEQYMVETGRLTQEQIDASWANVSHWTKLEWEAFKLEGALICEELTQYIDLLGPGSELIQSIIQRHFNWVKKVWLPTKVSYQGLGQMYLEHPDYRNHYNAYHPKLVEYIVEAMDLYANKNLQ